MNPPFGTIGISPVEDFRPWSVNWIAGSRGRLVSPCRRRAGSLDRLREELDDSAAAQRPDGDRVPVDRAARLRREPRRAGHVQHDPIRGSCSDQRHKRAASE